MGVCVPLLLLSLLLLLLLPPTTKLQQHWVGVRTQYARDVYTTGQHQYQPVSQCVSVSSTKTAAAAGVGTEQPPAATLSFNIYPRSTRR